MYAKVGDNVTLPCHLVPPFNVSNLTIEWRFKSKNIYVYRSGAKDNETSDQNYTNRAFMFHDEFEIGNISLTLTNVTKKDNGSYTCRVLNNQVKKGNVTLIVDENGAQGNRTAPGGTDDDIGGGAISGGAIAGIVVGVIAGLLLLAFIIYCAVCCKKGKQRCSVFPPLCNNCQHEPGRNDGEQNGNGNPGDKAEEIPLHNMEQPNQRVDESSPLS
ncbi:sodium channel subunit beta-4-like [Poecilia formosa]|uniref:sodium channel subunit beta-4-like n=1 Tax=Poecilia formosa TaxID=48698 RepID=UPI000443995C|nr:PREDICTED: sodium channel subunit beta-4-like [Poecilia formosa]